MRAWIMLVVLATAGLTSGCGGSRPAPYCAWTHEYNSCDYPTLEACRASLNDTDHGVCGPNPAYKGPPVE